MGQPTLPENHEARYEHRRWVILTASAAQPGIQDDVTLYSEPIIMNSYEWTTARKKGFGVHVLPHGGLTICRVYKVAEGEEDELVIVSKAYCADTDSYVKALGRIKTLGAAVGLLHPEERAAA
jgi:hypothetical protein